jgi:flagellin-like hook-associated protein FlgL
MSSVSLTASVRTSLSSLKSTSSQLSTTTDRLSTGKKVASAIDNPTNYFAAENYTDRAGSLESRLDAMGEATQMINAADNGITSIKSYLSQMKGIVNNALSNTDSGQRTEYGKQFNELIVQIQDVASDSSYGGINLIYGNASTTVQFGENIGDSDLALQGFNISSSRTELSANGELGSSAVMDTNGNAYALTIDVNDASVVGIKSASSGGGSTSEADYATDFYNFIKDIDGTTTQADIKAILGNSDFLRSISGVLSKATNSAVTVSKSSSTGTLNINYNATNYTIAFDAGSNPNAAFTALNTALNDAPVEIYKDDVGSTVFNTTASLLVADATNMNVASRSAIQNSITTLQPLISGHGAGDNWSVDWSGANYQNDLTGVIEQIEDMESALQTQSSKLANNLAIITTREDYTQESIDILNNGADDLTLADMNEEGANLLSLQTSQSLAVQALSLSSSSAANVLSILR